MTHYFGKPPAGWRPGDPRRRRAIMPGYGMFPLPVEANAATLRGQDCLAVLVTERAKQMARQRSKRK